MESNALTQRIIANLRVQVRTLQISNSHLKLQLQQLQQKQNQQQCLLSSCARAVAKRRAEQAEREGERAAPREMGAISWQAPPCAHMDQLRAQLGYAPTNVVNIAAFNATGGPAVARLYPLRACIDAKKPKQRATAEPFPTMFWLVCPEISARVSKLEDDGWVNKLQERLLKCDAARLELKRQHEAYATERWSLLVDADVEFARSRNWEAPLREVGIAGLRNFERVKCLHAHYAHFLASGDNEVGRWVHEELASH